MSIHAMINIIYMIFNLLLTKYLETSLTYIEYNLGDNISASLVLRPLDTKRIVRHTASPSYTHSLLTVRK